METSTPRPGIGVWLKVIFYTLHQFVRILSSFFGVIPIIGRIYIIRLALAYLAVFLTISCIFISLTVSLLRLL